jgi:anionic cell wall polymer biosynthesis LytR-Cps2A-Psr (LCP) family protein
VAKHAKPPTTKLPEARDAKTTQRTTRVHRRIDNHTIGTHVIRDAEGATGTRRGTRRSDGIRGGDVRRASAMGQHSIKGKTKKTAGALMLVVLVLLVGLAVAGFTYFKTTDSKLQFDDAEVTSGLSKTTSTTASYILCTADLRVDNAAEQPPNAFGSMLVRYDSDGRTLTFTQIPSNLTLKGTDGTYKTVMQTYCDEGVAGVITVVNKLFGIEVNHVISTDAANIKTMVQDVEGVDVTVATEADDPRVNTTVVSAGQQTLTPDMALTYLTCANYSDGFASTAAARNEFTWELLLRSLDSAGLDFASLVNQASEYIDTDYTTSELLSLGSALKPTDTLTTYFCYVPYDEETSTAATAATYSDAAPGGEYTLDDEAWEEMLANIVSGLDPQIVDTSADGVNPADVTVEVRNGASITGAATAAAAVLTESGYAVEGIGNTDDDTTYPETLIVYMNDSLSGAAKAVARDLHNGRTVNGGDFYSSDSDIIVIIGLDWTQVT